MKKIISFIVAFIIVASVCTGVFMLFGHFPFTDAAMLGIGAAIAGTFAPVIVAWSDKWFGRRKQ